MLDEFRSTYITWDKATRRIYSPITANASDSNGRKLNIQVVNSGQVENLTGATLHLYWETKDKTQHGLDAFTASDISKGEFELFYTTGMLSNVGELNATLVLVDSTGKVVSDWFKITVKRGINEDAVESENSFSSLTQALIDISDLEQNYAPRLNDLTAQLAEKLNKGGVTLADITKLKGVLNQTFFTDEFLQQMAGITPINATPPYYSITENKMAIPVVLGKKSKNLFNKEIVTQGYYLRAADGALVASATMAASDFVPVEPNTNYIRLANQSVIFFDETRTYISGIPNSRTFTTPPNAAFVRITTEISRLDTEQLEKGTVATSYESHDTKIDTELLPEKSIERTHIDFEVIEGLPSRNLFNKFSVTRESYVRYTDGVIRQGVAMSASDFIPVSPNTIYNKRSNAQFAFFDSDKNYISGLGSGQTFTTPPNAAFVRITVEDGYLEIEQLEKGNIQTPYEYHGAKILESSLNRDGKIITVKQDGAGDFNNLSDAIASITNSSPLNKYTIYIYEGDYDVYSTLTEKERTTSGIILPNYVDLVGVGDYDKVILRGALPDTTTHDESTRLSPLNIFYNNNLKNLTVIGKNCRYAIHADNGGKFKDYVQNFEDCIFIHEGNVEGLWTATVAWGEGTASGAKEYFKNCTFIGKQAFNTHNNVNFEKGDYHEFDNCTFISEPNVTAVGFTTRGSGKKCKVLMKGCTIVGSIAQNQTPGVGVTTLEYEIEGYGNTQVPHSVSSEQGLQKYINFKEEISNRHNNKAVSVTQGTPVKHNSYNQAEPMGASDDSTMFLGLAVVDNGTDEKIVVKTSGYFPIAQTALTGITTGDKVGIVNGQLSKVANRADTVAIVVSSGWLKLL